MKDDNTPTVNARTRKIPPQLRLRLEKAKELKILNAHTKSKRASKKEKKPGEEDSTLSSTNHLKLKKNTLNDPNKPPSKFRKRQIHKAWLPTHLFHTKRAHMTPPKEPLWRFAIPTTPTEKSYRSTHRAAVMRGCVAWDMSYMSTIGIEGVEGSLLGVLRALGVPEDQLSMKKGLKWRKGTRHWEGWVRERDAIDIWISLIQVIWCAISSVVVPTDKESSTTPSKPAAKTKRRLFLRVHPSAFLQLWNELLKVAKIQKPSPVVEDLRFEIGSIEITGPGATEALVGTLHPIKEVTEASESSLKPEDIWPMLVTVTNPASLPANAILAFNISDPRLHHPPRTAKQPLNEDEDEVLQLLLTWPPDNTQISPSLFIRNARLAASRSLPSQKSINRRKSETLPGAYPPPLPKDPQIPVLLLASRPGNNGGNQGSWTLLLPWKCVLSVWYSVMYYPLSSGRNPRFGGLREKRQLYFEQSVPWFPGDFPGTKAGYEWELTERDKRRAEWEKRPRGKRTEWDSVDLGGGKKGEIGRGWACDWERLLEGPTTSSVATGESLNNTSTTTVLTSSAESSTLDLRQMHHLLSSSSETISPNTLITISITLIHRGVPTTCARIYRLPTSDLPLRAQWLQQASPPPRRKSRPGSSVPTQPSKSAPPHELQAFLASSILHPPNVNQSALLESDIAQAGDPEYPVVPGEEDLIGFITTGNFNLGEGKGTGIGCVVVERVRGDLEKAKGGKGGLCIVREAGLGVGRIARWDVV